MLPDMSGQSRSLFCHSEKRSDEESLPSPYSVISPPCEGARNSYLLQPRSFPKSFHSGFISLINAIFFSRRQNLLLARDRIANILELLKVHQAIHSILLRKAFDLA